VTWDLYFANWTADLDATVAYNYAKWWQKNMPDPGIKPAVG